MLKPKIAETSAKLNLTVTIKDIDEIGHADLSRLNIRGVPTLVSYADDGTEISRIMGLVDTSKLESFFKA